MRRPAARPRCHVAQKRGRHAGRHRAFGRFANDLALVLPLGDQQDFAGIEDRGHAHRDGVCGDVFLAEKVAGSVAAGERVEGHQPCAAAQGAKWLVKANVAVAADAQKLDVDAAGLVDSGFVAAAMIGHLVGRNRAVGNVDVVARDVDVVEEMLVHPAVVALQGLRVEAVVFVEVKGNDVGEVETFVAMHANQIAIHADGCRAGRQSEHGAAAFSSALAEHIGDGQGRVMGQLLVRFEHIAGDFSACQRRDSTRGFHGRDRRGGGNTSKLRQRIAARCRRRWQHDRAAQAARVAAPNLVRRAG